MTSRERLLTVLKGEIPDCVPVSPDTSNMIPVKLTGKPFWDIYLYNDPPLWKAYIDCVKYFGYDSLMDVFVEVGVEVDGVHCGSRPPYGPDGPIETGWHDVIVFKNDERIVTRGLKDNNGQFRWAETVTVFYIDNPPSFGVDPLSIGLDANPTNYEEIVGRKEYPYGEELLKLVKEEMGDHGLVGVICGTSNLLRNENGIYDYYDDPEKYERYRDYLIDFYTKRFKALMALECKPDFIETGGSGSLIFQTPQIFKELALPIIKQVTHLCKEYGIPSHLHSCGPETEIVKFCYESTHLTVIDPLEIPPMGDCDLKSIKEKYGDKLVLKGNLHTSNVMLFGSKEDVINASKKAIDDAATGGRFILSTGDQCGRDTPYENIFAMIETARTYGRYDCQKERTSKREGRE